MPLDPVSSFGSFPPPDVTDVALPPAADLPVAPVEAPPDGWPCSAAPNGRVLGFDLSRLDEDSLLRARGRAAVYALGDGPEGYHPEREPLILVHGLSGDPDDLQAMVDRFKDGDRFQVYVLAYDDFHRRTSLNGDDFAEELGSLQRNLGQPGRDVAIVAHSMGGLVARRALNRLAAEPARPLERFGDVRLFSIDTGWHGYGGPPDEGIGNLLMGIARPFMPDGLEDMRAGAALFRGDPNARDAVERAGLFGTDLPPNISIDVAFATSGDQASSYDEGDLRALAPKLVSHYEDGAALDADPPLQNFWRALQDARTFPAFDAALRDLAARDCLTEPAVRQALARHFPSFEGDHAGVLRSPAYLNHLAREL